MKERKTIPMAVRYLMNIILVAAFLTALNLLVVNKTLSTYNAKVLMLVGVNVILAVSLNVATGYLGQLPLGHAGFMAVGAYASAIFTKNFDGRLPDEVNFVLGLVLAAVLAFGVGVLIGIAGAMLMVVMGWTSGTGKNDLLGISLALLSLLTWAIYLVITGKVSAKYSAVTQMKRVFLASTIIVIPFGWMMSAMLGEGAVNYSELLCQPLYTESSMLWGVAEMAFIIIFATVLGFFFIPYAMARIPATTVSVYTNLQPVVASVVAFAIGQDVLTWDKPVAGVLVLLSAYIVTVAANRPNA